MWMSASGYFVMRPIAWLRSGSASGLRLAESKSKRTSLGRRSRMGSGRLARLGPDGLKEGARSAKPGSLPAAPLPLAGAPLAAPDCVAPALELMSCSAIFDDAVG